MCCGSKMCCLCTAVILVVILIGLLFGFGVFEHGFHKIEHIFHVSDLSLTPPASASASGRPFLGFAAPPPTYH